MHGFVSGQGEHAQFPELPPGGSTGLAGTLRAGVEIAHRASEEVHRGRIFLFADVAHCRVLVANCRGARFQNVALRATNLAGFGLLGALRTLDGGRSGLLVLLFWPANLPLWTVIGLGRSFCGGRCVGAVGWRFCNRQPMGATMSRMRWEGGETQRTAGKFCAAVYTARVALG